MADRRGQMKAFAFMRGNGRTFWSPQMLRAAIDIVDANKPITGNLDPITQEIFDAIAQLPEAQRNDLGLATITRKLHSFSNKSTANFLLHGRDALNFRYLPAGVLSEAEFQAWANKIKTERDNTRLKDMPDPPPEERGARLTRKAASLSGDVAQLQQQVAIQTQTSFVKDIAPAAFIKTEMEDIYKQICASVAERLDESGVPPEEPVLNLLLPRAPRWRELLTVMVGREGPDFNSGLEMIQHTQSKQRLTLENLMVSAVAAAFTTWALEPSSLGPLRDAAYEAWFSAVQGVDASGASVIEEEVRNRLLRELVLPDLLRRATALAEEVDELLAVFAAPPSGGTSVKARPTSKAGTDPVRQQKKVKLSEPFWFKNWHKELKGIFEKALRLKVELDKKGGEYLFSFPESGLDWVTEDGGSHVQIGLFPSVEGRFQTVRGGAWSEWERFTDAEVSCVTMNDHIPVPGQPSQPQVETVTKAIADNTVVDSEGKIEIEESQSESERENDQQDGTYDPKRKQARSILKMVR